jgi:hypothetical protein
MILFILLIYRHILLFNRLLSLNMEALSIYARGYGIFFMRLEKGVKMEK